MHVDFEEENNIKINYKVHNVSQAHMNFSPTDFLIAKGLVKNKEVAEKIFIGIFIFIIFTMIFYLTIFYNKNNRVMYREDISLTDEEVSLLREEDREYILSLPSR